ncbi:hypothetical protein [Longirhabdus pacifica]|uniref:hypothetical protein n=1 Tax=Longirhabdus pacifica TaxID=2305227 RepID=UPI00100894B1|nr:hypothetical protein [Longirhabdus pacifica]
MGYKNKVKFHYDIPVYVKEVLAEAARKKGMTATELLSKIIESEYVRVMEERNIVLTEPIQK